MNCLINVYNITFLSFVNFMYYFYQVLIRILALRDTGSVKTINYNSIYNIFSKNKSTLLFSITHVYLHKISLNLFHFYCTIFLTSKKTMSSGSVSIHFDLHYLNKVWQYKKLFLETGRSPSKMGSRRVRKVG